MVDWILMISASWLVSDQMLNRVNAVAATLILTG
jgi:hypothetical protein